MGYVTSQWGQISSDLLQHIALTLLAVAIGTVLSIPLAMLAWRYRAVRTPIFGIASALYIIPSLALFAILGPITGYVASYPTAEIALVGLHAAHPHLEHVAGLNAVPAEAREAATAMGYSRNAALLARRPPTRPALHLRRAPGGDRHGHRAGHGHRPHRPGRPRPAITYGFTIGFNTPIIVGLVFSVALAAVFDLLIVGVQRLAVPWTALLTTGAGGLMSDWDHFPTLHGQRGRLVHHQCQLDWQSGIPTSSYARPSSRSPWCSVRWWWAAASASYSATPAAAAWWR